MDETEHQGSEPAKAQSPAANETPLTEKLVTERSASPPGQQADHEAQGPDNKTEPVVHIAFGVIGALLGVIVGIHWTLWLFRISRTNTSTAIISATIAVVGAFFTAMVTLVGLLFRRSTERSRLKFQQAVDAGRLRLEQQAHALR
jgi:hypothetical protein